MTPFMLKHMNKYIISDSDKKTDPK